jgi:hypothetical protein
VQALATMRSAQAPQGGLAWIQDRTLFFSVRPTQCSVMQAGKFSPNSTGVIYSFDFDGCDVSIFLDGLRLDRLISIKRRWLSELSRPKVCPRLATLTSMGQSSRPRMILVETRIQLWRSALFSWIPLHLKAHECAVTG